MSTQDERKLFVAGLPDSITENELRQLFEATGSKVLDVSLPRHRDTGRPRGFGFVTLSTSDEAASARSALDGSMQAGRSISVRPFQSEPPRRGEGGRGGVESGGGGGGGGGGPAPGVGGPDRTVYVGNLPYDATAVELETLITSSAGGPVVRVHLPVGPDGRARGFGFVTMGSAEAANSAIVALRDVELRGRRLMVNIAHPRGSGGGGGGGDRPDRSGPPPSRRDDRPPQAADYDPNAVMPPPGMLSGKPDARRGERWEKAAAEKKKKKRRGRPDQQDPSGGRRGRTRSWEDWDED
jgi:RNA recognition motif-containing protein